MHTHLLLHIHPPLLYSSLFNCFVFKKNVKAVYGIYHVLLYVYELQVSIDFKCPEAETS